MLSAMQQETSRITTIRAIRQAAAVRCGQVVQLAEFEISRAKIHGMNIGNALFSGPGDDLVGTDHFGTGSGGNANEIADMISMPVADKNIVCLDAVDINVPGQRIASDERIKQYLFAACFDSETRMAKISEIHVLGKLIVRLQSYAFECLRMKKKLSEATNPDGGNNDLT
jgi:hypothetical protein